MSRNHDFFNTNFAQPLSLFSASFFFFFKVQSKIGVRIVHRRAFYTGKYGNNNSNNSNNGIIIVVIIAIIRVINIIIIIVIILLLLICKNF